MKEGLMNDYFPETKIYRILDDIEGFFNMI